MRNPTARIPVLILLLLLTAQLQAATDIVLQDGQIIRGQDLQRDGDVYLVELTAGGFLTVPVSLVKQLRWVNEDEDDGEQPRPTADGLIRTEPEQLAGVEVTPVSEADALENLPPAARFRPNVIDPNWIPKSAFGDDDVLAPSRSVFRKGVINPIWEPSTGFSDADVLAAGRSTFRASPIDPSWTPEDGFKRRDLGWRRPRIDLVSEPNPLTRAIDLAPASSPTRADEAWRRALRDGGWFRRTSLSEAGEGSSFRLGRGFRKAAAPSRARACGELSLRTNDPVWREAEITVALLKDSLYEELPLELYEVVAETASGKLRRAVFTVDGGHCRTLGGDLRDLMGAKLSNQLRLSNAVASFNAALGYRVRVELPTEQAKLDYALAVVTLTDSQVSGHRRARMLLVEGREALAKLDARQPESCSESKSTRRRALKSAQKKLVKPRIVTTSRGEAAELTTWSSVDGEIVKFSVSVEDDGKIAINRERVASHVGDHVDREAPAKP